MKPTLVRLILGIALPVFGAAACKNEGGEPKPLPASSSAAASGTATAASASSEIDPTVLKNFGPLPNSFDSKENPTTEDKATLGRMLYFEKRLSLSNTISCNTCHLLDAYGVDGNKTSEGHSKKLGTRNSPTVYNAAGHFAQFWDGRAKDVEAQAKGPILNPVEMGMPDEKAVVAAFRLETMPQYVAAFKKAFPGEAEPITFDNLAKAIAVFERKLVTPSRWDKFLRGDPAALTADEKRGFNTFVSTGCTACHFGTLVGGSTYQKVGAVVPWPNQVDQGRYEFTKQDSDRMMFKVPSLRNVEKTAPYFHDGSVATLPEAVRMMAKHQLGRDKISDADVAAIVAFLKSLTGEIPKDYITPPALPPSNAKTNAVGSATPAPGSPPGSLTGAPTKGPNKKSSP